MLKNPEQAGSCKQNDSLFIELNEYLHVYGLVCVEDSSLSFETEAGGCVRYIMAEPRWLIKFDRLSC